MDTFFYTNAAAAANEAIKAAENKQYLSSWAKTVPARINYLADTVANAAIAPFSLLKACFGALKAIYTWGHEVKDINDALKEFHGNINHSLSSFAGIFFTQAGINLRKTPNIEALLCTAGSVAMVIFSLYVFSQADGAGLRYNSLTSSFEPSFFWYSN